MSKYFIKGIFFCLVVLFVSSTVLAAEIAYVKLKENSETLNNNAVSTGNFATAVSTGNLIVCQLQYDSATRTVLSVADSVGNTYTQAVAPAVLGGTNKRQAIWYAYNVTGSATFNVTVTFDAVFNAQKVISCSEYSGILATSDPKDVTSSATGNSANSNTGTGTTTKANELIYSAVLVAGSVSSMTNGTIRSTLNNNATGDMVAGFPLVGSGDYTHASLQWVAQMVTFKGAYSSSAVNGMARVISGSAGNSIVAGFPLNNKLGNFIFVGFKYGGNGRTLTVSDTAGNTYNLVDTATQATDGHQIWIYYAMNIAAGANTVTATASGGAVATRSMHVAEFAGVAKTSALDKSSKATANASTAINSGATATTSNSRELLLGFSGLSGAGSTMTPTGSFTSIATLFNNTPALTSYSMERLVSATGAYSATATASTNNDWSAIIATFKLAEPIKHKVINSE